MRLLLTVCAGAERRPSDQAHKVDVSFNPSEPGTLFLSRQEVGSATVSAEAGGKPPCFPFPHCLLERCMFASCLSGQMTVTH